MKLSGFASAAIIAALARAATAQVIPPPLTATVVNFDDMVASDTCMANGPITTEYAGQGVIFSGFGKSGGALINGGCNYGNNSMAVSPPNIMGFASILLYPDGGIEASPETLTFYPPIVSLQFDTFTFTDICEGTNLLFVQAFAADGSSLGGTSVVNGDAQTIQLTFPTTPADHVVISSSKTCGTSLFKGVETFALDNIAFVRVGTGVASKCGQGQIDAAGKKAKAEATCYSKALQKGVPVDPNCIQKAVNSFNGGITKSQDKGDCLVGGRHGDNQDVSALEAAVDNLIASSLQLVSSGAPGPDICSGKKMASIGKKAQSIAKCWSKAAQTGAVPDEACAQKAASSFNGSLKTCGTPTQLGPVEFLIDQFADAMSRAVTVPTTTTTTTTSTTTTTTQPPPLGEHLSFTTTPGTANCTLPNPDPPLSGELDSDTSGTLLTGLGLGCLYIGGGAATVAPSLIPENATSIFNTSDGVNLTASLGTSREDCTTGPQPSTHCVNNPTVACTTDDECAFTPGGCAPDPTCFFGPPVPVNGFPPSCVINVFAADGSGTLDIPTGQSSVSIQLSSRVYLAAIFSASSACPQCIGGFCDSGQNAGQACSTSNSANTSLDCPPFDAQFVATLPVNLTPLSSGTATTTAADGLFCSGQANAGAFGQAAAEAITQVGSPSGNLSDGAPHAGVLVSNFCIPPTGNIALDGIADLPGPGSLSLPGNAQLVGAP
jgi:hypothetical protein